MNELVNKPSKFSAVSERNNLPRIRFHDLRHTYISILINSKIPDNEIAARAGTDMSLKL